MLLLIQWNNLIQIFSQNLLKQIFGLEPIIRATRFSILDSLVNKKEFKLQNAGKQ